MNLSNLPPVGTPDYWRAIRQLTMRAKVDIDRLWGRATDKVWSNPSGSGLAEPVPLCNFFRGRFTEIQTEPGAVSWFRRATNYPSSTLLTYDQRVELGFSISSIGSYVDSGRYNSTGRVSPYGATDSFVYRHYSVSGSSASNPVIFWKFTPDGKTTLRIGRIRTGGTNDNPQTPAEFIAETATDYLEATFDRYCWQWPPEYSSAQVSDPIDPISTATVGMGFQHFTYSPVIADWPSGYPTLKYPGVSLIVTEAGAIVDDCCY